MNIFVIATFPTLVAWSVVLLVFHVLLQAQLSNRIGGRNSMPVRATPSES